MLRFFIILNISILAVACSGPAGKHVDSTQTGDSIPEQTIRINELEMPQIPAAITDPKKRADFLVEHFWDRMDFADTSLSLDTAFMEQNFANFASLFNHANTEAVERGIAKLMNRASVSKDTYIFLTDIADKYLFDHNSPMRDERSYRLFAMAIIDDDILSETEKARTRHNLELSLKNRVGSKAADFPIIFPDGSKSELYDILRKTDFTLVLFYDPDCENCKNLMDAIRYSQLLFERCNSGKLQILAIYPGTDRTLWEESVKTMPYWWKTATDNGAIDTKELYDLTAIPSLYLITRNGEVTKKDTTFDEVYNHFEYYP